MRTIKLLDCTLRDGGYINDWRFGRENIIDTVRRLEEANMDIVELGFLRDEPIDMDRTVFRSMDSLTELMLPKKPDVAYAAMSEVYRPIPMELIPVRSDQTVDIIRVIVWKDMHDEEGKVVDALEEGFAYCKEFVDRGYRLFVQPARVEQYSDQEFVNMLKLFSRLDPEAIYIVDSWGTMYAEDVLHYLDLADKTLDKKVSIGFHGHNNMMQAFANAVGFINSQVDRELILDASIYGMGRGAGNLNTEIIAKYLNEYEGKEYGIHSLFNIYENCIKEMGGKYKWGFSPAYFMTALYHANPQYGTYYGVRHDVDSTVVGDILKGLSEEDKVLYTAEKAEALLDNYQKLRDMQ